MKERLEKFGDWILDNVTKSIILAVVLLVAVVLGGCRAGHGIDYSEGVRDVTILKISKKGVVYKTYEVESLMDGMRLTKGEGGGQLRVNYWAFSVSDPAILAQLETVPSGARVRIHYKQRFFAWWPNGDTSYFATSVERLEP